MHFKHIIAGLFFALMSVSSFAGSVDINTADVESIAASMKGIGLKKAEAIVAYRNEKGPFSSIEDLINVKGIGLKMLEKNRGSISVGGSK